MKRSLYIFSLLLCQFAFAELNVEWIDENTIVVTGYGYGDTTNETALGSCTNCTAITPAELTAGMDVIISNANNIQSFTLDILGAANFYLDRVNLMQEDISGFRRFLNSSSSYISFSNYVYTVSNTQTFLDDSHKPNTLDSSGFGRWINYNNGIYDYATQYVSPELTAMENSLVAITNDSDQIMHETEVIKSTSGSFRNLPSCQSCGGGDSTNDTSCTSCPCEEQWLALLDYVRHIDEDQHKRHVQLNQISNNVFNIDRQFDSYARLVSGVLYNDATIVVDDGENSWSNVYRRGYSDLYDYDKSNILQRIELLLFGVSYNTSTNWGDSVDSIDDTFDDVKQNFTDAEDTLRDQGGDLKDDVELIEEKFTTFVNSLNFFGAGNLGEFSLIDPITVFDAYTFDVDSAGFASDLGNLQQVSRTCFQIFYWVSAVLFMVWFWWSFIRFLIDHVFSLIKFFNNLLT